MASREYGKIVGGNAYNQKVVKKGGRGENVRMVDSVRTSSPKITKAGSVKFGTPGGRNK